MFRKIMDFTEKQKNRKNHIQNGMFKLSWRGNVSYTNTTLAFERDLSNIFFLSEVTDSIRHECFVFI